MEGVGTANASSPHRDRRRPLRSAPSCWYESQRRGCIRGTTTADTGIASALTGVLVAPESARSSYAGHAARTRSTTPDRRGEGISRDSAIGSTSLYMP